MAVMSKPVNLAFVVAEEKANVFINSKSSSEVIKRIKRQAKEMMQNSTFNGKEWEKDVWESIKD